MGGIALSTAVQALYYRLGVTKPWEKSSSLPAPVRRPIFILSLSHLFGLSNLEFDILVKTHL